MSESEVQTNEANDRSDNTVTVEGVFEPSNNKTGQLLDPAKNGRPRKTDPFVPREMIRRFKLKRGNWITASALHDDRYPNPKIRFIEQVDGLSVDARKQCYTFQQLTTVAPDSKLKLECKDNRLTTRVIDLFCPIGKGQRGLIVAPPRTGKTTLLKDIAEGVHENHPEMLVMVLLVDERPEEVTDFKRDLEFAEIYASSNDEDIHNHIRVSEIAIERAKRQVEVGKDVILLLDSITRLSRAHNSAKSSGRTMSGGLDIRALEKPRQLFSSARNTEEGGSLTIIASALIETGSRMDDLIFQEFKGTGNMEMVLDRKASELRLWPAININSSGTRKEELLLDADTLDKVGFFRRALSPMKPLDATETLVERMSKTSSNAEFLRLLDM
ncbi:transcription termination factor Rho [Cerasicoccus arenae]|uniref:Transcription termination factor Rho n=1 Tax=Cerasicoccus arenae TaxID=424488 RepID=A0A8J3GF42_9BACT|nr:transcription termination factor Rho [Cerasicoccus arenae]MBK1857321.1 transcription termination factor Rho [Cerasicoccus arenae]GHC08731.1 transcription termination factor Rho [Cerasicoccus arenae]